jgi:transcriptional regulator with XRE-family HTH domain
MSDRHHHGGVNDLTIGRTMRVLRRRLGMRQIEVAVRAEVSQQLISRVECGRIGGVSVATLRRVFAAVDADAVTMIRWRAGQLDRLLDEDHAEAVARVGELLRRAGWLVILEASFSEYGERGSVDILAWHAASRTILVIEVKTSITSTEELLRRHDMKTRLAPKLARERFGDAPAQIARLLVVTGSAANRTRVRRLDALLVPAYPVRGRAVGAWLRRPIGDLRGLVFTAPAAVPAERVRGHVARRVRATTPPPAA